MRRALIVVAAVLLAGCGGSGSEEASEPVTTSGTPNAGSADLGSIKRYLLRHTTQLRGFTGAFAADAQRYYELAEAAGFDERVLWPRERREVGLLVTRMKRAWIEGNPYYERMEGVVAGTPSLAEFDVIIDAGSSASEDPESAVPFDVHLPDGRVLRRPGNFFNLTEGALWGTLPDELAKEVPSTRVDLDADGRLEFGEVIPDARFLKASTAAFHRYAGRLAEAAAAWRPRPTDAFTALVVMVPTMTEYFGQWSQSRFVRGSGFTAESFNVVSRLSDIRDIVGGLEVVYRGVEPLAAKSAPDQSRQTRVELGELAAFVSDLERQERAGKRFTPEQAETLGAEAQGRATAIAGQVSQLAARLQVPIQQ